MDIHAIKIDVVQKILNIQKASLLEEINKILDKEKVTAYSSDGEALDQEEYIKSIDKARLQAKLGKTRTQEDVERRSENW